MSPIPSHHQLIHIQRWLSSSSALRNRLRQQLLAPVTAKRHTPLFQELLVDWDDSSC
ncbi:MAG: hypothetical protein RL173_5 [Fibrobacterota bacterium]|jgi:hypothetical protein